VEDAKAVIREVGLDPCTVQLEMTEGVAMLDPKLTADLLSQLKRLGVRIIVDHFGTGRMPLAWLYRFPLDGLKIDRLLVSTMLSDRGSTEILSLVLHVAHKLGLKVIAEGIEEVAQVKHLVNLGCEVGQGYYFSKPVEAKLAQQLLSQPARA
jgi:EAL domain-containing protein (putative c-di-GMP-specific phosphodiesterase class I)